MKTREKYDQELDKLFVKIRTSQDENIKKAAHMIADAVASKHCVYVCDSGHIIDAELIKRAGGFVFLKSFKYDLDVKAEGMDREVPAFSYVGLSKLALEKAGIIKDDVLIIGSVSGIKDKVVDLALAAKEKGIKVIAITAVEYASKLESKHPSGKRLFEVNDLLIDNCAPYEDAMVEVEGLDAKICPASGLSAAYIMWCVCADTLDVLIEEKNITPRVYRSVNAPGNREVNHQKDREYKTLGY